MVVSGWVMVQYGGGKYPGEVKGIDDDIVRVACMEAVGTDDRGIALWKWPLVEDVLNYPKKQIVKVLKSGPIPHDTLFKLNRRELFIFKC